MSLQPKLPVYALSFLFLFIAVSAVAQPTGMPADLKCEYMKDPLGIDTRVPRLSWRIADTRQGAHQAAWEIFVSTDSTRLSEGNMWRSGKQQGRQTLVRYAGKALQPFTRYFWTVRYWDQNGADAKAEVAHFETGMMEVSNWRGAWISDSRDIDIRPAPYFRKTFDTRKRVASARVYVAAAGLYELSLNGHTVGNQRLDPAYTRFDQRVLYVTHDVTQYLQEGGNAVGILLGNGWFNHQSTAVWYFHEAPWRGRPTFCLDLRITYDDGSVETISSGTDWKTSLSPVVFNSIYTAEHYDARLEQPGWNTTAFDDSQWKNSVVRPAPTNNIVAQVMHPIRNVETIPAKTVNRINDTTWVFDLGRNIAGVSEFTVRGEKGTIIRLKHGERLYPNGHVDLSNIDIHYRPTDDSDPFQTDIFILKGEANETFMPRFNYKGFQFVEVTSSKPLALSAQNLVGHFMHSDVPPAGNISSSNPTIDKIWEATNNAYLSNLFGYPTDCPQREKNGWTGDAHIAIETGLYSFDGITIYEKWMADHRDEQQPNGTLPAIIPTGGWGYQWANGPDWTSTIAIIPWTLYTFYGDTTALSQCYENIRRYVDNINARYPSGLTTWGLGDWVPVKSKSPVELTSSLYYFADVSILARAARLFGHADDYEKYDALAVKIRNAINDKYLDRERGMYGSGLQTELSAPLFWGVVPDELKTTVANRLAERVKADNYHLDVGILGAKAILNALSDNGQAGVAYRLAAQESYPSWGFWIKNGATTLYENWDIHSSRDVSMNHIMFGEIGAWLYKGLGGIHPDPQHPGFANVLLSPHFVSGLDKFEAAHQSRHGKIVSSWKRSGKQIIYSVVIPANTTATIALPLTERESVKVNGSAAGKAVGVKQLESRKGEVAFSLEAGAYEFAIR